MPSVPHASPATGFDFAASGRRVFEVEAQGMAAVAGRIDGAFSAAFDGLEDLSDKAQVAERVKTFVERNKALVVDNSSGGGTGSDFHPNPQPPTLAVSDADRIKQRDAAGIKG